MNAGAIPEALALSELFGHAKGAFTGATSSETGLIREADGGTLFLDEVADLSLEVQAMLLRTIESGYVRRIGEQTERKVDVQWILASNRNLRELADAKRFRGDLLDRIPFSVSIPPLRERGDDIIPTLTAFVGELGFSMTVNNDAERALRSYPWPGNTRELLTLAKALAVHGTSNDGRVQFGLQEFDQFVRSPRAIAPKDINEPMEGFYVDIEATLDQNMKKFRNFLVTNTVARLGFSGAAAHLNVSESTLAKYDERRSKRGDDGVADRSRRRKR